MDALELMEFVGVVFCVGEGRLKVGDVHHIHAWCLDVGERGGLDCKRNINYRGFYIIVLSLSVRWDLGRGLFV